MEQTQSLGDKLAIGLSALCVIHCLAMPVLLIILPTLGAVLADTHELFHQVILFYPLACSHSSPAIFITILVLY
jgi:hypothetical protein|nr:MerC domain-containing protein [uncultured Alteromonas sp.]